MTNFTMGKLQVSLMTAHHKGDLEAIKDSMRQVRPDAATIKGGWGSIDDDTEIIGDLGAAPVPGDPDVVPADEYPERLWARFYYFSPDASARAALGSSASLRSVYRLKAVDVMISVRGTDELLVVTSSRNRGVLDDIVIPNLTKLLLSLDNQTLLTVDSSPLDLVEWDIFMWLLHRGSSNRVVSTDVSICAIREITSQDPLHYGANLSHGVDLNRRELLALITNDGIRFGPAKLGVTVASVDAYLDFELFIDGGYSVHSTESHYSNKLTRAQVGVMAVLDLTFNVIPAIRELFLADKSWKKTERPEFLALCEAGLARPRSSSSVVTCDQGFVHA